MFAGHPREQAEVAGRRLVDSDIGSHFRVATLARQGGSHFTARQLRGHGAEVIIGSSLIKRRSPAEVEERTGSH